MEIVAHSVIGVGLTREACIYLGFFFTLMWIINKPGRILSGVMTISLILEQFDIYQVSCSILMAYLLREIFPASGKISPGKPANSLSIIFDHDYFLLHQIMG